VHTPRSSYLVRGRSHPGVAESQSVQRPVAPRISHATAGRRNFPAAPIAKITIHAQGRPAIGEDAQPQAPPAGLRREGRAFVGRCGH